MSDQKIQNKYNMIIMKNQQNFKEFSDTGSAKIKPHEFRLKKKLVQNQKASRRLQFVKNQIQQKVQGKETLEIKIQNYEKPLGAVRQPNIFKQRVFSIQPQNELTLADLTEDSKTINLKLFNGKPIDVFNINDNGHNKVMTESPQFQTRSIFSRNKEKDEKGKKSIYDSLTGKNNGTTNGSYSNPGSLNASLNPMQERFNFLTSDTKKLEDTYEIRIKSDKNTQLMGQQKYSIKIVQNHDKTRNPAINIVKTNEEDEKEKNKISIEEPAKTFTYNSKTPKVVNIPIANENGVKILKSLQQSNHNLNQMHYQKSASRISNISQGFKMLDMSQSSMSNNPLMNLKPQIEIPSTIMTVQKQSQVLSGDLSPTQEGLEEIFKKLEDMDITVDAKTSAHSNIGIRKIPMVRNQAPGTHEEKRRKANNSTIVRGRSSKIRLKNQTMFMQPSENGRAYQTNHTSQIYIESPGIHHEPPIFQTSRNADQGLKSGVRTQQQIRKNSAVHAKVSIAQFLNSQKAGQRQSSSSISKKKSFDPNQMRKNFNQTQLHNTQSKTSALGSAPESLNMFLLQQDGTNDATKSEKSEKMFEVCNSKISRTFNAPRERQNMSLLQQYSKQTSNKPQGNYMPFYQTKVDQFDEPDAKATKSPFSQATKKPKTAQNSRFKQKRASLKSATNVRMTKEVGSVFIGELKPSQFKTNASRERMQNNASKASSVFQVKSNFRDKNKSATNVHQKSLTSGDTTANQKSNALQNQVSNSKGSLMIMGEESQMFGYNYNKHQSIRNALHGTIQKPKSTKFNQRKLENIPTFEQKQNDLFQDQSVESINPLKQDKEQVQLNIKNFQNACFENPNHESLLQNHIRNASNIKQYETDLKNEKSLEDLAQPTRRENHETLLNTASLQRTYAQELEGEEKFQNAKIQSQLLYQVAAKKLSHVMGLNQDVIPLDNQQFTQVKIEKIGAMFYKVKLEGKTSPMKIMICSPAEGTCPSKGDATQNQMQSYQVFWSFNNHHPHEGQNENDGMSGSFAPDQKIMKMQFAQKQTHAYFAIYTYSGLHKSMTLAFGKGGDHIAQVCLSPKQEEIELNSSDEEKLAWKREFYMSKAKKEKSFKDRTQKKVKKLIENEFERSIYLNYVIEIQEALKKKKLSFNKSKGDLSNKKQLEKKQTILMNSIFGKEKSQEAANDFQDDFEIGNLEIDTECGSPGIKVLYEQQHNTFKPQTEQEFFKDNILKKAEADRIKEIGDLEKYKYKLFFTIKHEILKQIKDQKIDERIAFLRRVKFVRSYIILQQMNSKVWSLAKQIVIVREERILQYRQKFSSLKILLHYRKRLRTKYGIDALRPKLYLKHQRTESDTEYDSSDSDDPVDLQLQKMHNKNKMYRSKYIIPSMRILYFCLNKQHENYYSTREIIRWCLDQVKKRTKLKFKINQTIDTIVNLQNMVRGYFSKKKFWLVQIAQEVEKEVAKLREFLMLMKAPHREPYESLLVDLGRLTRVQIDVVCTNLVQYIKDMHVLDVYRYRCQHRDQEFSKELIDAHVNIIKKNQENVMHQYEMEEMIKFPARIEKEPGLIKQNDKKQKKKRSDESSSPKRKKDAPSKKGGNFMKLAKLMDKNKASGFKGVNIQDSHSHSHRSEQFVTLEEIENLYVDLKVHKKEFRQDDVTLEWIEPTIHIKEKIDGMRNQPGRIIVQESKQKGLLNYKNVYEFSQFREIILCSLIEYKREMERKLGI